ncbi:MAG: PxKF domain-containing protein [ANME-2 cluster archaeon]|jgi:streptogramin lyase|nr:PxKF domain-containing protein [ANME-2 cluster archaeon]
MEKENHKFGTLLVVLFCIASINVVYAETTISSIVANPDVFNSNTGSTHIDYDLTDVANGNVFLTIFDSANNPVRTIDGDIQNSPGGSIVWDGKDDNGITVLEGEYTAMLDGSIRSRDNYLFSLKFPGGYDSKGIAVDPSSGNIYFADRINHRIQKFSSTGEFITELGSYGSGDGQFFYPNDIAVDLNGDFYVADTSNVRIQKFSSTGEFITKWGSYGTGDGQFTGQTMIAVDSNKNIYVADAGSDRIQKFSSTGEFITKWGGSGTGDGQFSQARGVDVDQIGNVYVAEFSNNRIQKFNSNGEFITKWGSVGTGDGQFSGLIGIAIDSSGDVYVSDVHNARIQKFNSNGAFITKWGSFGTGDGQFFVPFGVAVDSSGNVYVSDERTNTLQKFAPSVSTISAQTYVLVDNTPPIIECGSADGLWHGSDVSIACIASDGGADLANSDDASFSLSTNVAVGQEIESASTDSRTVCDLAENCATAGPISGNKVDKKAPSISILAPITSGIYTLNQAIAASYSCSDGGSGIATCDGPVPNGNNFDTSTVGSKIFDVNTKDLVGNTALATNNYNVIYNFNGFFRPIDNLDSNNELILNAVKAGSAIPVKFSLNGNQGLSIMTPGFPKSSPISCDSNAVVDPVDETVTAGSSSLSYDASLDQYIYVWKTDKAWSNTCRQLNVKLIDGTMHVANFKLK